MSNVASKDTNHRPLPAVKPVTRTDVTDTTYSVARSGIHRIFASAQVEVNVNSGGAWTIPAQGVEYVHFDPTDTVSITGTAEITECA
jgi:hypothetical protein